MLTTDRLELVPATAELLEAELQHDRGRIARLLGASVPATWPPPLTDEDAIAFFLSDLERRAPAPDEPSWGLYYFIRMPRSARETRTAIGTGGYKGAPSADGTVEIGYSVLDEFQRAGYATEAVAAFVDQAASHPAVRCVTAQAYPDNLPSIRVLEKNGFRPVGPGWEPNTIRFERSAATTRSAR